jgi:hypothetical protein
LGRTLHFRPASRSRPAVSVHPPPSLRVCSADHGSTCSPRGRRSPATVYGWQASQPHRAASCPLEPVRARSLPQLPISYLIRFSSQQQCHRSGRRSRERRCTITGRVAQLHRFCSRLCLHLHPTVLAVPSAAPIVEVRGPIWLIFFHHCSPELGSARVSCSAPPSPFSRAPASPHGGGAPTSLRPPCHALERHGHRAAAPPCTMLAAVLAPVSHSAKHMIPILLIYS